jgi:hypothetical protein
MLANDNTSTLIRKAYIDAIGVPPTIEEIDWYLVYNKDRSYELAVDYVINNPKCKWNISKELAKLLLLSKDYKEQAKVQLLPEQIIKNLFYITGIDMNLSYTEENKKIASCRLIQNAILCSDGETETIDYLANSLMSRGTNLEEINYLTKLIKNSTKSEEETWYNVLMEIMKFPEVNTK